MSSSRVFIRHRVHYRTLICPANTLICLLSSVSVNTACSHVLFCHLCAYLHCTYMGLLCTVIVALLQLCSCGRRCYHESIRGGHVFHPALREILPIETSIPELYISEHEEFGVWTLRTLFSSRVWSGGMWGNVLMKKSDRWALLVRHKNLNDLLPIEAIRIKGHPLEAIRRGHPLESFSFEEPCSHSRVQKGDWSGYGM